jgi:transcriptional regulator with XRE-family HTH domain
MTRLESGRGKHSPSIATLEKYAHALGCRLELRLVNEMSSRKAEDKTKRTTERTKKLRAA